MCHPIPVKICITESPFSRLTAPCRFLAVAGCNPHSQTEEQCSVLIRLIEVGYPQSAEELKSAQRNYYGLG